ncbi:peptidoglycan D,D-transpeptidase FtsI family protein [Metaclostridioides mangenotii]|uniref:peptidoglycan D,D-transpeptidase FtsI family protein n=1 Tax=Metaclostridioides mangenotii TaxID=1540 RepID=UPI0026ED424B|nr:penicillin-binding protein 2 [Clostridioides mangenotii]
MSRLKNSSSGVMGRRIYILFIVLIVVFGILIYRIVDIQVIKSDKYSQNAENQSVEKVELNSGRGIIYDRNGKKLTDTVKKTVLVVEKEKLNNNHNLIDLIEKATGITELDIYKAIQQQMDKTLVELEVKKIDSQYTAQLIKNGILIEEKTSRYSKDNLLSHTIGYINKVDNVGKMGIEKSLDKVLKDSNEKYVSVFKAGRIGNKDDLNILKGGIKKVVENANDKHVKLTIDSNIQKKVEKIADKEDHPTAIIVSDVNTGEILAMSSRPNFDPNNLTKSLQGKDREFENRVIKSTYAPGSVFKMVVLFSALENGIVDENYTYTCTGQTKVGNTNEILKCHKHNGHGFQNLNNVFSNSCNPAFLDIGIKLGSEKILKTAEKLHLFEKVDIGLDEENMRKKPEKIFLRNLAIGQENMEFTPIQINQMTQIIANNGTYKPLKLFDSIVDNEGRSIKTFKSNKSEEIISPYVSTRVKDMMKLVSTVGTAKVLKDLEGGSGVKTGTAQSNINKIPIEHGWTTGYYPADRPKYVITAIVEGNTKGNKSAVPLFKEICRSLE